MNFLFRMTSISSLLIFGLVASSCGETKTLNRRGKFNGLANSSNVQKSIVAESAQENTEPACKGATTTSLALVDFVSEYIDGAAALLEGDKSLCDKLLESKKPVALFQIVKAKDCGDCRDQIENISLALDASEYSDGIQHFIIATDNAERADVDDLEEFIDIAAASAVILNDSSNKTWEKFASDKSIFKNATILTMAMSSKGVIFNDNADSYLDSILSAEELIQAEVDSFDKKTPASDEASTLNWDGLANLGDEVFEVITVR